MESKIPTAPLLFTGAREFFREEQSDFSTLPQKNITQINLHISDM
jgi:hypothetical protein